MKFVEEAQSLGKAWENGRQVFSPSVLGPQDSATLRRRLTCFIASRCLRHGSNLFQIGTDVKNLRICWIFLALRRLSVAARLNSRSGHRSHCGSWKWLCPEAPDLHGIPWVTCSIAPAVRFWQYRNGTWHYRITILPEEEKLKRVLAMNLVCVSGLRIRPQNHPKKQALNNNTVVLQKCSLHSAEGSHEDFSSQLFGKVPGHAIYHLCCCAVAGVTTALSHTVKMCQVRCLTRGI